MHDTTRCLSAVQTQRKEAPHMHTPSRQPQNWVCPVVASDWRLVDVTECDGSAHVPCRFKICGICLAMGGGYGKNMPIPPLCPSTYQRRASVVASHPGAV